MIYKGKFCLYIQPELYNNYVLRQVYMHLQDR